MIYIPIELQLQWIREDVEDIKNAILCSNPLIPIECPDCKLAKSVGAGTCVLHAPEYAFRIEFPFE